jgi:hypothetical protein
MPWLSPWTAESMLNYHGGLEAAMMFFFGTGRRVTR